MTPEERKLWHLFLKKYPVRFLRQKVIDQFIVDFYCHQAKLIIEIDGSQHFEPTATLKDNIRTHIMEKRNLQVIRIPNHEIHRNFYGVCEYIDYFVKKRIITLGDETK